MKKAFSLIFIIIIYCFPCIANNRIAIVGNSMASNFAWYNQIDIATNSCAWVTNHAISGDGIDSNGVPYEFTYWASWEKGYIHYPKNYGKGRIHQITEDCINYDYMIFMNGENEVDNPNYNLYDYLYKLDVYFYLITYKNPNLIKICFPISNPYNYYNINVWNQEIKKIYKKYNCIIMDWPNYMKLKDLVHFDKNSNILLWKDIQKIIEEIMTTRTAL